MSSRRSSQHEGPLLSGHAQTCCLARDVHGLSPVLRPAHAKSRCGLVPRSQVSSIVAWMCAPLLSYGSQIQQCVVHYVYAFGLLNLRWLNTAEMCFSSQSAHSSALPACAFTLPRTGVNTASILVLPFLAGHPNSSRSACSNTCRPNKRMLLQPPGALCAWSTRTEQG
jgi:hypothetical protein